MDVTTILCATDFSEHSDFALKTATALARDKGAKLLIVHVDMPYAHHVGSRSSSPDKPEPSALREKLESTIPDDPAVSYEHRLLKSGSPAEALVQFARQENVDLIVMGTHGRTGLRRILMGSTAEEVVRNAPCPVLPIKLPMDGWDATENGE